MLTICLVIYFLTLFILSIIASRRVRSAEDYFVAGRRLPLWLAWGTLFATWFGAATVLGASQAARDGGLRGTLLDPFASGVALILAGLIIAKPLWNMKLLSIGDFYGRIYGKRVEVVAALMMVPGYFGWIGAQFLALASVIQTAYSLPEDLMPIVAIGCAIVVLALTLLGGMWSVTLTDTLQISIILVGLIVLFVTVMTELGQGCLGVGLSRVLSETPPSDLTLLPEVGFVAIFAWLGTFGSGCLGNLPGQDLTQRIFAARSAGTAMWACFLSGFAYLVLGLIPVLLGLASRILEPEAAEPDILGRLATQFLSPPVLAIFVVALLSVLVSTATSAVLAPATILSQNLLSRIDWFADRRWFTIRLATLSMVVAGLGCAFLGASILDLLESSLSITLVSLFVPLIAGIVGQPRSEKPALLAMIAGLIVWVTRESMESFWLAMPQEIVNPEIPYVDWLSERLAQEPGWIRAGITAFATVPSAISGTMMSGMTYVLTSLALQAQKSQPR